MAIERRPILPSMSLVPPSPTDSIAGIGEGTKLLVEAMFRVYGARRLPNLMQGVRLVDATKGHRKIKTMVIGLETLHETMLFVCRKVSRRHLRGLELVLERIKSLSTYDGAVALDSMARAIGMLVVQLHKRRRFPVHRKASIGGDFDRLLGGWCKHGVAAFLEAITQELLGNTVKGRLS